MFKKIIAFFKQKLEEERTHKEGMKKRDRICSDLHRMHYSRHYHHSFIKVTAGGVTGGECLEGIVCYADPHNSTIDILTPSGLVAHLDLMEREYSVVWNYQREDVIHYNEDNWVKYQSWCDRIGELDKEAGLALFANKAGGVNTQPLFWPENYAELEMPRTRWHVYIVGYNATPVKTLEELKNIYAELKRKSLAPVREWYDVKFLNSRAHPELAVRLGGLVKHKNGTGSKLAIMKSEDGICVSGGVVYDRVALNLDTDEFELIMSYHYREVGDLSDLG